MQSHAAGISGWFDESAFVSGGFLTSVGPLRILKRYLHHRWHIEMEGGSLPPGLESPMANLGKTRPQIVVDSPWSMRVANVNIAYPMTPTHFRTPLPTP